MAQQEKTTEEIVRELKQGQDEKENFRLLYCRYSGPIRGFFEKRGVAECEELKDDVFLAVYKNLRGLREGASFESWLFTIAQNRFKNWLKQQKAKKHIEVSLSGGQGGSEEFDLPAPPTANPEIRMLEKEKLEKVWGALEELPER